MDWQTPTFQEIDMSAEIGAYSPDMPGELPDPRFVEAQPEQVEQAG